MRQHFIVSGHNGNLAAENDIHFIARIPDLADGTVGLELFEFQFFCDKVNTIAAQRAEKGTCLRISPI